MNTILNMLLSSLLLYKYFAIFIVIFLAAVALPLPTDSMLLAAGALASQGYFSFSLALMVAVGANIAGDSFGYFIAKRYGRSALQMLHIRTPSYIDRLEQYIREHPGPTIFFTRFFGTADPLGNIFSGLSKVPFGVFLLYDIPGNFISNGGFLYAGYILGDNWKNFSKMVSTPVWVAIGGMIILIFILNGWRKGLHHKKERKGYLTNVYNLCHSL